MKLAATVRAAAALLVLATIVLAAPRVQAQEENALKILKAMSDYLTSQNGFSARFDVDLEVITPDVQKIQFASTGKVALSRPGKLRAERLGGSSPPPKRPTTPAASPPSSATSGPPTPAATICIATSSSATAARGPA
jgi:hypothetical protein